MEFYTSDGCKYSGMAKETIERLRAELGRETTFVEREAYEAFLKAQER